MDAVHADVSDVSSDFPKSWKIYYTHHSDMNAP